MPGNDGGDHDEAANAESQGRKSKVSCHGTSHWTGDDLVARLHKGATYRSYAHCKIDPALGFAVTRVTLRSRNTTPGLISMPKTIAPLPLGQYWATPRAPFPLDGANALRFLFVKIGVS
ncbi:protein of unknown function [Cupriavidus neocaledonicus]|uniref:Uncharacterized protein n=1 Tax=Cupriavidus neocaledonicus TaxID=1040979 RepID=A0A375H847_9BURK|nr:protein of unknown function [Cupriavidus neocaledonicus]